MFKAFEVYEPHELQVLAALARLCDPTATEEERDRTRQALLKLTQLTVPSVDVLVALTTDLLQKGRSHTVTAEPFTKA
ncbi:MAG: hypothetical protein Q8M31_23745 [Beijerinckiaceae bacterium]|nr:hypothetical protein [Beijerinckiaceae bacterium]